MRQSVQSLRDRSRGAGRDLRNAIRRFTLAATSGVLWFLDGFEDADGNVEREEAEVFPGIGFYARPKNPARAEAVVTKVGGESGHPAIVAMRDQDTLAAAQLGGSVGEDESMLFTSLARVYVKADGTIEARTHAGIAVALAKADHKHDLPNLSSGSYTTIPPSGATKTGESDSNTDKLRAE